MYVCINHCMRCCIQLYISCMTLERFSFEVTHLLTLTGTWKRSNIPNQNDWLLLCLSLKCFFNFFRRATNATTLSSVNVAETLLWILILKKIHMLIFCKYLLSLIRNVLDSKSSWRAPKGHDRPYIIVSPESIRYLWSNVVCF